MSELFIRTEEIHTDDIFSYFVETRQDRNIIDALKAASPVVLVGSRGVGKSFLLRIAELELKKQFTSDKIFPVYVSFRKSSLISTNNETQFHYWMLARLCSAIVRSLHQEGLLVTTLPGLSILAGEPYNNKIETTKVEKIAEYFEESWHESGSQRSMAELPSVDSFIEAIEDVCRSAGIKRFALFIDEAAHIFRPDQQRQFFTLFRDLRSPFISCNAAVYPGVTSYGETFQPVHDATMRSLDRDILSADYVGKMREIVEKQADVKLAADIARNAENFSTLAYAASGNPRILLQTVNQAPKMNSQQINEVLREYYRTKIWSEHSLLPERYAGHQELIDWGQKFIENDVLPDLRKKNSQYLKSEKNSTCFFWISRDVPQPVKEALRLLAYTGIVVEHANGIKATRSEIGTRYAVNLGCLFALEATPASNAQQIAKSLTPKRMTEFGASHPAYQDLLSVVPSFSEPDMTRMIEKQLTKSIGVLDITKWQKDQLLALELTTIGDVLRSTEDKLQEAPYVGGKRARQMRNAAIAAVYEYLSG